MFFDPVYLLFAAPAMLLSMWAQARVKSAFNKYSQVRTEGNMTGAQIARRLLDAYGLYEVKIEQSKGFLSDHYDPRSRTLRLSPDNYDNPSVAAAGIAAHEAGHALQHAEKYFPLQVRSALVPAVQFGSNIGMWVIMAGAFLQLTPLAWAGIALFALATVFSLVTLPVEFDASARAKKLLVSEGIMFESEMDGVNKVLGAAAWTYVAAAIASIGTLLYYVFRFMGSRD